MNVVINCPHCNQEMIIDEAGVGETVDCPACSKEFVIPEGRPEEEVRKEREAAAPAPEAKKEEPKKEAPKKEEKKPMPSKEELAALLPGAQRGKSGAEAADAPGIKVKSIQHHLCIDMGKDTFDAQVAKVLGSIPREDIISVNPLSYSYKDSGGDIIADFGVMVIYEKKAAEKKD